MLMAMVMMMVMLMVMVMVMVMVMLMLMLNIITDIAFWIGSKDHHDDKHWNHGLTIISTKESENLPNLEGESPENISNRMQITLWYFNPSTRPNLLLL